MVVTTRLTSIRPPFDRRRRDDVTHQCPLTRSLADTYLLCPAPNRIGGALSDALFCLTSVCLTSIAYIVPKSRTERPRKTKIGTAVAHVTLDSDNAFRVKSQGHQAALVGCSSH